MENNRRCDICNIDVHSVTYAKHLRSKKCLENIMQEETIIPRRLFEEEQAAIKKIIKNP